MPEGYKISDCRVCDSKKLEPAVDLGFQPWCGNFLQKKEIGKEPVYPLCVVYCHRCGTPQLDYTVPKEVMFASHTYLSGITRTLDEHFETVAARVDRRFFKNTRNKIVLDIGSNDGTQLKHFKNLGYEILGVESSKSTSEIANAKGIPTISAFFNLDFAVSLKRKFHIIHASGVFFHLEELHSATMGIREALHENGVFVVQFLYMKCIVENCAFDLIYHEHLLYYNLKTIEILLNRHGLAMFDAYLSPIHGGSIIGFISHEGRRKPSVRLETLRKIEEDEKCNEFSTYIDFARRIREKKNENLRYLKELKKKGKKIFGFGAPAKGNTLLNYFEISTGYIDCLVEKNELRRNLYSPGMHIPVVMEDELKSLPDVYYVLAWNYKKEILAKNQRLIDNGIQFYFPINTKG